MRASILTTGNEILSGTTVNTNMSAIGRELAAVGSPAVMESAVPDDPGAIKAALARLLDESDCVIVTGGLGPTTDDITVEAVASLLGLELVRHEPTVEAIKSFWKARRGDAAMPEINLKQALAPAGSDVLPNPNGTAPGICVTSKGKLVFLLPGPPRELIPMLKAEVMPRVRAKLGAPIYSEIINTVGVPESGLQELVVSVVGANPGFGVSYRADLGQCALTFYGPDKKPLTRAAKAMREKLGASALRPRMKTLVDDVSDLLVRSGLTLTLAESCTGGMVAAAVTDLSGASAFFKGSVVAYSNELKMKLLGVRQKTLDSFGAVSAECAAEMAAGARSAMDADVAVAVTGIAGPGGATAGKPVGTVHIAVDIRGVNSSEVCSLFGDRAAIRQRASISALDLLRRSLHSFSGI